MSRASWRLYLDRWLGLYENPLSTADECCLKAYLGSWQVLPESLSRQLTRAVWKPISAADECYLKAYSAADEGCLKAFLGSWQVLSRSLSRQLTSAAWKPISATDEGCLKAYLSSWRVLPESLSRVLPESLSRQLTSAAWKPISAADEGCLKTKLRCLSFLAIEKTVCVQIYGMRVQLVVSDPALARPYTTSHSVPASLRQKEKYPSCHIW